LTIYSIRLARQNASKRFIKTERSVRPKAGRKAQSQSSARDQSWKADNGDKIGISNYGKTVVPYAYGIRGRHSNGDICRHFQLLAAGHAW
jgi:hypothetical protein